MISKTPWEKRVSFQEGVKDLSHQHPSQFSSLYHSTAVQYYSNIENQPEGPG